jgi:probable addiction module antidote protein
MSKFRNYRESLLDNLKDRKEAQAYLEVALEEFFEDHDQAAFLQALRTIAEAQGGLTKLANKANLNRPNLYKALSEKGHPKLETIAIILKALGFKLNITIDIAQGVA